MIISVDHGNKSIKTPNALFTSGLIVSDGLQGFKTDYICWNNKYYTLTEQRIAYLRDKTEDERFYVLTLFAIAKELERRKVPETLDPIPDTIRREKTILAQESKNEDRKQRSREAVHDGKQVERMPAREDMAPQHSDDVI